MFKLMYYILTSPAFASPGSGHSHAGGDTLSSASGIGIILVLAAFGFWLLKDKKK